MDFLPVRLFAQAAQQLRCIMADPRHRPGRSQTVHEHTHEALSFSVPLLVALSPVCSATKGRPLWRCRLARTRLRAFLQRQRLALPFLKLAHELFNCLVGLGMAAHLREKLRRHGKNVGTGLHGLVDVSDVADAADNDLRFAPPFAKGLVDLANDRAGIVADVADTAPEQADVIGPGASGHDRLVVRHAAGAIDADSTPPQLRDHPQFVPANWHLDVQVRIMTEMAAKGLSLGKHLRRIRREYLDAKWNIATIFLEQRDHVVDVFTKVAALLLG